MPNLLAEIERLKRKALSRGVVLTSKDEAVPAEDVVVLKQIFSIADDTGDGEINMEQLGQLHTVLGEPLNESELKLAFKAMDHNKSGTVSFDDFLSWYTLAHSSSGILSKKGSAYDALQQADEQALRRVRHQAPHDRDDGRAELVGLPRPVPV